MAENHAYTGENRQIRNAGGHGARNFPALWLKVEEFLRDFARNVGRVADSATAAARPPLRGQVHEARGPGVLLELSGSERRFGVLPPDGVSLPLFGARHRLLLLRFIPGELLCQHVFHGESGIEVEDLPMDLAADTQERFLLERVIREALLHARTPSGAGEAWEEPAMRLRLALETMLGLARAGRRALAECRHRGGSGARIFGQAVREIVARHTEALRMQDVARAVGLSDRHFARMMQAGSGTGFSEHLLMVRLMRARDRLVAGAESVSAIAATCGFGSRDHLIRAFRQSFGLTPLQFRKQWFRAAGGKISWASLLAMPGREPVVWCDPASSVRMTSPASGGFHTLVVANASSGIRVLQRLETDGSFSPQGALQPGQAMFVHRDVAGSLWRVLDSRNEVLAIFQMPPARALALLRT